MNQKFLLWSNEHQAWWKPNSNGYTKSRKAAGQYSVEEAFEIVKKEIRLQPDKDVPYETLVPVGGCLSIVDTKNFDVLFDPSGQDSWENIEKDK